MCLSERQRILDQRQRAQLREAATAYDDESGSYDEVFEQIGQRLRQHGFATKLDIGALVFWKRIPVGPWASTLQRLSDQRVKEVTGVALAEDLDDATRLHELRKLHGFNGTSAVTSTLLTAWKPDAYEITDSRARHALRERLPDDCPCDIGVYLTYLEAVRLLARELTISTRDVDKGLFRLGGS